MAPGKNPELLFQRFRGAIDELFTVRVLDPAMGSGHFLVEAVAFLK
jgi:type I restriction-modification system DNA methylase subunit